MPPAPTGRAHEVIERSVLLSSCLPPRRGLNTPIAVRRWRVESILLSEGVWGRTGGQEDKRTGGTAPDEEDEEDTTDDWHGDTTMDAE